MKKSFMSVSLLIVSISLLALFVCSSAVSARNSSRFVYNKSGNVETVYTLDASGKFLTPKVKHELVKNEAGEVVEKVTSRWNEEARSWEPAYRKVVKAGEGNAIVEYAAWNEQTQTFSRNQQKAVYHKGLEGEVLSYVWYKWDTLAGAWDVNQHLLFENYLAADTGSMK